MARQSLETIIRKNTNNFTDPEFVKAYNEECDKFYKEDGLKLEKLPEPKPKPKANTTPENAKAYA